MPALRSAAIVCSSTPSSGSCRSPITGLIRERADGIFVVHASMSCSRRCNELVRTSTWISALGPRLRAVRLSSIGTRLLPMNPVAPVTKYAIVDRTLAPRFVRWGNGWLLPAALPLDGRLAPFGGVLAGVLAVLQPTLEQREDDDQHHQQGP